LEAPVAGVYGADTELLRLAAGALMQSEALLLNFRQRQSHPEAPSGLHTGGLLCYEDVAMSVRLLRASLHHLVAGYAAARQREGARPEEVVSAMKQLLRDTAESQQAPSALPELLAMVVPWCVDGYYE
jgi:hypothetical protein